MPKTISQKIRKIRRAAKIGQKKVDKAELLPEEKKYFKIVSQIQDEFNLCWWSQKNKLEEGLKRLKLYNNQKRDKGRVGDPLIFTIFDALMATLWTDKLGVEFGGREEGDEEMAENLNGLAEYDYDEMEKAQHDYDWDWDALAFGRGLSYFDYFDPLSKTPIPEVWDPLTFLRDPDAVSVSGNRLGNGAMRFGGREVLMTKEEMESNDEYFNLGSLKKDTGTLLTSLFDEAKRQRKEAQGYSNMLARQGNVYKILQWFTVIDGEKYLAELGNDKTLIVRLKKFEDDKWPLIDRPCYPMAHDWDGVSVFDILEDKQRFRASLLNIFGDSARADLYPMYLFNLERIPKSVDRNFGFNKGIPVMGPGALSEAWQPLQKQPLSQMEKAKFILEFLDASAQRALATPELQMGAVEEEKRTATELTLAASHVDTRYSKIIRIFGLSDIKSWKRWYEIYKRDFKAELGKKVVRLMGSFGPQWRDITRDKIIVSHPLGPDIKIESRIVSEARKIRTFNSIISYAKNFIINNPNADLTYMARKAGKLLFPTDEVERMLPLTIDERIAKEENEKLNDNEVQIVRREHNHVVHLRVHAACKENNASKAHNKTHRMALMIKRSQPELFPIMPEEMPMKQPQGRETAIKAPEGATG